MGKYRLLTLTETLHIGGLYSLHYFQFAQGYVFSGEKHDFWEMVYVDRGEAEIGAGSTVRPLRQGQLLFHEPGEFHAIWANEQDGANLFVISFACEDAAMRAFRGQCFTLRASQRRLIAQIISEGRRAFGDILDISDQETLTLRPDAPLGAVQMIVVLLAHLLLELLRAQNDTPAIRTQPRLTDEDDGSDAVAAVQQLMRSRLDGSLRFPEICTHAGMSATTLKETFRRVTSMSVMENYRRIRLEEARRLLRAGHLNVSQIAEMLGYSSTAAFSRQFRQVLGLTPTEYQRTVDA